MNAPKHVYVYWDSEFTRKVKAYSNLGGTLVVLYASSYHNVQTVVNVSARSNMDGGLDERLGKNYMERAKKDGFIDIKSKKVAANTLCKIIFRGTMIDMVYLTPSRLINSTRTPCLSDSTLKQRLPINNHPYTLTLNTTTRQIKLEMAAGDSTTNANLDQNPGVEQKRVIIQNNCGEKLVGLLHETGSKEVVILCHGFRDSKDYSMMVELAFALEKSGISAFRFDFSGNGESEGLFEFGNYRKEVDDLQAVIQHFTAENRVASAILGHSKGGNVVVLHASLHHDIRTVVNMSGRYKMDRGIEERLGKDYLERAKKDGFIDIKSKKGELLFRVTEESLMERLNTNMHEAGLKVDQDCRVLTVHGSVDEVIPVEDALEFAKIIPNHELRIIEGANHNYNHHRDELVSVVLAFLKDNMHRA
ncbi:hypothetical protein L1987_30995 [Smallanthus sonchifolius]|uniref:Uncharacterized protein n=1 Tax=Smallanthus sonchifolius TaxID=185202 RepID=A0ACB9I661_9ASTR|nr:hypothetical protein L1987_30995 [Smallanthus sonchifolius]